MTPDNLIRTFAERLGEFIRGFEVKREMPHVGRDEDFNSLALDLFALQFEHNLPYRKFCQSRKAFPGKVRRWENIPAIPTAAFKDLELTCLPSQQRSKVFHSSGTTEHRPSRHFHNATSLALYETSSWIWFARNVLTNDLPRKLLILTPPPTQAPHSSLVHMCETIQRKMRADPSVFVGSTQPDGSWTLNFDAAISSLRTRQPILILGTAFSFVHLLDHLASQNLSFNLPPGSRVMETGGYKGRSRTLPKHELHAFITHRLGIPNEDIICEYGMSELSSQAYDTEAGRDDFHVVPNQSSETPEITRSSSNHPNFIGNTWKSSLPEVSAPLTRPFQFPPWARAQIISPETGKEVSVGETGLIRVFDLANVYSVMAIQTEDLAIRHEDGFELIGRAALSEPRGCSLMARAD